MFIMNLSVDEITQCMQELNMTNELYSRCIQEALDGQYDKLYADLRLQRVSCLEELHETQERLDRLDSLIYDIKKKKEK